MIILPDFVAYEQKCAAASALRADALPLNKSALFDALCPPGSSSRLWELAEICQNTGNFAEAARLGERAAAAAHFCS